MKKEHKVSILSETESGYMAFCDCCSELNFVFKNVAMRLEYGHFAQLNEYFRQCRDMDANFQGLKGKNVLIKSPVKDLCFCFCKEELDEICILFREASLMLEVIEVLS